MEIRVTCDNHPEVELTVNFGHANGGCPEWPASDRKSAPYRWNIHVEPCPKCLAEENARGYETGENDAKFAAKLVSEGGTDRDL